MERPVMYCHVPLPGIAEKTGKDYALVPMTWEVFKDILADTLRDSLNVFLFVLALHILLSFFENRIATFLTDKKKTAPVYGALFGLIPQCGTSVLGADIFAGGYITTGTLVAIFLSCSDEAVIVLLASGQTMTVLPLLAVKFITGLTVGITVDAIQHGKPRNGQNLQYSGHAHSETAMGNHLLHPLYHAFEIFIYVLVINLVLGVVINLVGEEQFAHFMADKKYFTPLLASVVGLIPNCAASVLLSELYIEGSLSFGALAGGLLVNSGMGILVLFKKKDTVRSAFAVTGICFAVSVVAGYAICLASGF